MKKEKLQDERVLSQKRKIGSDAFQILFLGLFLSIIIQSYIFDAKFSQYAVEMILLIVGSLYVIVRNIMVGNNLFSSDKVNKKSIIINSIICGIIVTTINVTLNYINFRGLFINNMSDMVLASLITFVCSSAFTFIVLELLYIVNKKKQIQIEKELEEDE
ncbi:hypothetical protein [Clostridium tertium]|uniref:Uncharacterized protein n=1 Tax=Clostridium tertium TaxID=1559 RepID=A0A6N3C0R5_9CLOT